MWPTIKTNAKTAPRSEESFPMSLGIQSNIVPAPAVMAPTAVALATLVLSTVCCMLSRTVIGSVEQSRVALVHGGRYGGFHVLDGDIPFDRVVGQCPTRNSCLVAMFGRGNGGEHHSN